MDEMWNPQPGSRVFDKPPTMTGTVITVNSDDSVLVHWDNGRIVTAKVEDLDDLPYEHDEMLQAMARNDPAFHLMNVADLPIRGHRVTTGYDIQVTFHVENATSEIGAVGRIGLTGSHGLRSLLTDDSGISVVSIDGHRCVRQGTSEAH